MQSNFLYTIFCHFTCKGEVHDTGYMMLWPGVFSMHSSIREGHEKANMKFTLQ